MARLKEFIEVEEIGEIQQQLKELNFELLTALNQTNVIRELITEKNRIIKRASEISNALLPEVKALNRFIGSGLEDTPEPTPKPLSKSIKEAKRASPIKKRGRGRPRKHPINKLISKEKSEISSDDPLAELKANLAKLRQEFEKIQ